MSLSPLDLYLDLAAEDCDAPTRFAVERLLREKGRAEVLPPPSGSPGDPNAVTPAALLSEQTCPNCRLPFDDGICAVCGRMEINGAASPDLTEPRLAAQKERGYR